MTAIVAVAAAFVLARWWRQRRAAARAEAAVRAALPELLELLVVLVRAGLTPPLAFAALAELAPDPARPAVREVVARQRRGARFAVALEALAEHHPGPFDVLVAVLAHAERHGEPLAPLLDRLAAEARHERRRAGEADARRLPVRLSFPLVGCILPAFVVLAVVPMLLGTFSSFTGLAP